MTFLASTHSSCRQFYFQIFPAEIIYTRNIPLFNLPHMLTCPLINHVCLMDCTTHLAKRYTVKVHNMITCFLMNLWKNVFGDKTINVLWSQDVTPHKKHKKTAGRFSYLTAFLLMLMWLWGLLMKYSRWYKFMKHSMYSQNFRVPYYSRWKLFLKEKVKALICL